jgi:hypothetical protein
MSPLPILLICGCQRYKEYLTAAIERFGRQPGWEVIGVVGGADTSFDSETHVLTVAAGDTYETLPAKLHAAFVWISKHRPLCPGVFKTDDDMVFDRVALVDTIYSNLVVPYWGVKVDACSAGIIDKSRIGERFLNASVTPTHPAAVYCFGAGYWISARALKVVIAAGDDFRSSYIEDVCTGFVLNRASIVPQRIRVPYREEKRTPDLLLLK